MNRYMLCLLTVCSSVTFSDEATDSNLLCSVNNGPSVDHTSKVYFANGLRTSPEQALSYLNQVRSEVDTSLTALTTSHVVEYHVAYNHNASIMGFSDTAEAVLQKVIEQDGLNLGGDSSVLAQHLTTMFENNLSKEEIRRLFELTQPVDASFDVNTLTDDGLESFRNTYVSHASQAISEFTNSRNEYVEQFEADLIAGSRVLVLAHGQAALFANQAIEDIKVRNPYMVDSISTVSVGSLASENAPQGIHVTAYDDRVVAAFSSFSSVLPGNVENDLGLLNDDRTSSFHHFISDYYRTGLNSKVMINEAMIDVMASLDFPEAIAGTGSLRFTLSWGDQPDIDLHVREPSGNNVYYLFPQGDVGYLDVDDVNQYGPENYYVDADDLRIGPYIAGVNYFEGSQPEEVTLKVFTQFGSDRQMYSRRVTLGDARGDAGSTDPLNLFAVTVYQDAHGRCLASVHAVN